MSNDITTLAIETQSQEAERNLRTFNELLFTERSNSDNWKDATEAGLRLKFRQSELFIT